jgi:Core-2/I-Branching enzyme
VGARPLFTYMVLSHKEPRSVESMAKRILELSPTGCVVLHHDASSPEMPWDGRPPDRVFLTERGHVLWGDWSMVEASLRVVRFAFDNLRPDWLVLLSGEDRPAVDLSRWEDEVARSGVDLLGSAAPLPRSLRFGSADQDANQYLARCLHRWIIVRRPRWEIAHRAMGGVMKLSRHAHPILKFEWVHRRDAWAVGVPRRQALREWEFYSGSQWLTFSRRSAAALLDAPPAVTSWFEKCWIPDESYFHTLLGNTPGLYRRDEALTFLREQPERAPEDWRQLELDDLPALWAAETPFARKVDPIGRPEVVAAIDARVDAQRVLPCCDTEWE